MAEGSEEGLSALLLTESVNVEKEVSFPEQVLVSSFVPWGCKHDNSKAHCPAGCKEAMLPQMQVGCGTESVLSKCHSAPWCPTCRCAAGHAGFCTQPEAPP